MKEHLSLNLHLPGLKTIIWSVSSPAEGAAKSMSLLGKFKGKGKSNWLFELKQFLSLYRSLSPIPQPGFNIEVQRVKRESVLFTTRVSIYWALSICQYNTMYIICIISFCSFIHSTNTSCMNGLGTVLSIRVTTVNKTEVSSPRGGKGYRRYGQWAR